MSHGLVVIHKQRVILLAIYISNGALRQSPPTPDYGLRGSYISGWLIGGLCRVVVISSSAGLREVCMPKAQILFQAKCLFCELVSVTNGVDSKNQERKEKSL